jgi:transposase-like protein
MSRRRYTEKERDEYMEEFERGDASAAAFCREKGLAYQTFLNWRRRRTALALAEVPESSATEFVEVELPVSGRSVVPASMDPAVELVLAGGSVLRIYPTPPHRS